MDAAHRAAEAGDLLKKQVARERLARDRLGALERARAQVASRQRAEAVEWDDVLRRPELVVLLHRRRAHGELVDPLVGLRVPADVGDRVREVAADDDRLEPLRAHHGAHPEAAEVPVGVDVHAGVADLPLAGRADPDDRPLAGAEP